MEEATVVKIDSMTNAFVGSKGLGLHSNPLAFIRFLGKASLSLLRFH